MDRGHGPSRPPFIALFALSGFTGLIYESIWSHYLKLFLGHAAYAQFLVLAIFMGGMAVGAWAVSRATARWRNLILIYALIEGLIGVSALLFHELFVQFLEFAFSSAIPALAGPAWVDGFKWTAAALLIAPQSILLGMTFPLMAGGVVRRFPSDTGRDLALLYFSNSLGAAVGALVSGFWLIDLYGLPGTMRLAGGLNLLVAVVAYRLSSAGEPAAPRVRDQGRGGAVDGPVDGVALFFVGALITGAASFIYEIAWIRMLSLVLGTTLHSFELMLSAFITGLALGGLWIKGRIDRIADPVRFLGRVQIAMGALALATLVLYNLSFLWVGWLVRNLTAVDSGYLLFNLGSHAVAFAIMLPATFCAGMTLPLFTYVLLRRGEGERSIGRIYAANTLGSIAGVGFAVHLGLPLLGVKLLMVFGALLDIALGALLIRHAQRGDPRPRAYAWAVAALLVVLGVTHLVHLDPMRMASGVYRTGNVELEESVLRYHRDGKTATVTTYLQPGNVLTIATNGKPDASLTIATDSPATPDEITMVMLAAVPLAHHPRAKRVVNIGFGSGLTSHVLLTHPGIEQLDNIEIEQGMVEASRDFMPRVHRAYRDPRSRIHIEDAKTWFAKQSGRYDIIISEPSNPWVSGVGGLFSREFYRYVVRHLEEDGLFVQWLHLYESNDQLVGSIIGALDGAFEDYVIYNSDNANVMVVATKRGPVPPLSMGPLEQPALGAELRWVGVEGRRDLEIRRIASKATVAPLFALLNPQINSDYYPVLGNRGPRARFEGEKATTLPLLGLSPLPLLEMLEAAPPTRWLERPPTPSSHWRTAAALKAWRLRGAMLGEGEVDANDADASTLRRLLEGGACPDAPFDEGLHRLAEATIPYLDREALRPLWIEPRFSVCDAQRPQWEIYRALAERDAPAMSERAEAQLGEGVDPRWGRFLLTTAMLGARAGGEAQRVGRLWSRHAPTLVRPGEFDITTLTLLAVSARSNAMSGR